MAQKNWLLVLLFFWSFQLLGQDNSVYRKDYVETFPKSFQLAPFIEIKSHALNYEIVQNTNTHNLNYISNYVFTAGIRIKYKGLGFALGKRIPITAYESKLGPADNFGIGFTFIKPRFSVFTRVEAYKGFYLQNTDEWLPGYKEKSDAYYQRPDLRTISWFTSVGYFFNHKKFSMMASVFELERQKKAAIGFVVGSNFSLNHFNADSSLVPSGTIIGASDSNTTYLRTYTFGLYGGIGFTIPLFRQKKFYFTSNIIPGYSIQHGLSNNQTLKTSLNQFFSGVTNELRFGIGYNSDNWFTALTINSYGNTITLSKSENFAVQNGYLRYSFGLRLGR